MASIPSTKRDIRVQTQTVQVSPERSVYVRLTSLQADSPKPLVVFIHYWGGSSATWHKLTSTDPSSVDSSISASFHTMVLDLCGFGSSAGPEDCPAAPEQYAPSKLAGDVMATLEILRASTDTLRLFSAGVILVGHSMGGKIAMSLLASLVHSSAYQLRGLVLVGPAPPTALHLPAEIQEQMKTAYTSTESMRWTVQNILAEPHLLSDDDLGQVVQDSLRVNPSARAAWPAYGMAEDISPLLKRAFAVEAATEDRPRIEVVVGSCDKVEPAQRVESETVAFLRNLGLVVDLNIVDGVGHLMPLERPRPIADAIQRVCKD